MDLLLKRDRLGDVLQGSDRQLLARAALGDDLTLYIESEGYDEFIIFDNYAVSQDRVSALSLPHLDHGDLADPTTLDRESIAIVQYIYDSKTNNVLIKDFLDEGRTLTTVFARNPYYGSYAWYSTRSYEEAGFHGLEELIGCGDQFKVRLDLADDFGIVVKPDIVYFPHHGKDYMIKSSAMLLPSAFVADPYGYLATGRPLSDNSTFSTTYFAIGSDKVTTILGKQRFFADKAIDSHVSEGEINHRNEGRTLVTHIRCAHAVLVPAD